MTAKYLSLVSSARQAITTFLIISFFATTTFANDDLEAGILRLEQSLNTLIGNGGFDSDDEEFCRSVLWTSFVLRTREIEERLGSLTENAAVPNMTSQIQRSLELQTHYQFLYKLALDRQSSVGHPREMNPEVNQYDHACSMIVKSMMKDPEYADFAESARGQAAYSIISNLLYHKLRDHAE